jgi:hypothetical protein
MYTLYQSTLVDGQVSKIHRCCKPGCTQLTGEAKNDRTSRIVPVRTHQFHCPWQAQLGRASPLQFMSQEHSFAIYELFRSFPQQLHMDRFKAVRVQFVPWCDALFLR